MARPRLNIKPSLEKMIWTAPQERGREGTAGSFYVNVWDKCLFRTIP